MVVIVLVAFRFRCNGELISAVHCVQSIPEPSLYPCEEGKKKKEIKMCRCSFIIKSPHRRTFISLRNTSIAGALVPWKANARARLRADGILNQVSIFFLFFSTPMSRPPRFLPFLPVAEQTKPRRVEVVGNNISVGVVMVAEY